MKDLKTIEKNVRQALLICLNGYEDILASETTEILTDHDIMSWWVTAARLAIEDGAVFVVPKNISDSWVSSGGVFEHETIEDYRLPYPMTVYVSFDTETCEANEVLFAAEVKIMDDHLGIGNNIKDYVSSDLTCHVFKGLNLSTYMQNDFSVKVQDKLHSLRLSESVALVPSAEAMMNAQSTVEHHVMPLPAKLAKKRLAKNPLNSVHGFTLLGVQRGLSANEISAEPYKVTAHFRRGHWKHRKTGTFWWDSCVVGSGETKPRTGYIH